MGGDAIEFGMNFKTDPTKAAAAATALVTKMVLEGIQQLGKAAGHVGAMATTQRFGEIGAHGFGAAESTLKAWVPVPILNDMLAAPLTFGRKLFEAVEALRKFSDQLQQANFKFAEFSAAMALAQVNQEIRDIHLSRERGDRRSKSADYLSRGRHALESEVSHYEDMWAKIQNYVVGWTDGTLAKALAGVRGIWQSERERRREEEVAAGGEMYDWLEGAGGARWTETYGRSRRFGDVTGEGD